MLSVLFVLQSAWAQDLNFGFTATLGEGESPALFVTPPRMVGSLSVNCTAGGQRYQFEDSMLEGGCSKAL